MPVANPFAWPIARLSLPASLLVIALAVALLTLSAKIQVPLWPVPTTLQSLVVVLLALALPPVVSLGSLGTYLLLGTLGAPVFAGAVAGPLYWVGPTGGYLLGFVAMAAALASLRQLAWVQQPLGLLAVGLLAHAVLLACGSLWLAVGPTQLSLSAALAAGALPFLVGSLLKSALASATLTLLRR